MIIDAHAHFGPGLRTDSPLQPPVQAETAADLIAVLDRVGIDKAIVFAPRWLGGTAEQDFIDPNYEQANAAIAAGVSAYPDRLIGFARVNPKFGSQAVAELERCFTEYGFRGLKLDNETEAFSLLDIDMLSPLIEVCAARQAPVILHTWMHPSQPVQLINLAQAFPSVNFIMAHSAWRLVGDAVIAAEQAPNLFFDTAAGSSGLTRAVARRFGIDRVVFGTDLPYNIPELEINRIRRWGRLDDSELEQVMGGTIARLIGMSN